MWFFGICFNVNLIRKKTSRESSQLTPVHFSQRFWTIHKNCPKYNRQKSAKKMKSCRPAYLIYLPSSDFLFGVCWRFTPGGSTAWCPSKKFCFPHQRDPSQDWQGLTRWNAKVRSNAFVNFFPPRRKVFASPLDLNSKRANLK